MKLRFIGNENEIKTFLELIKQIDNININSISLPYSNKRKCEYSAEVRIYTDLSIKSTTETLETEAQ